MEGEGCWSDHMGLIGGHLQAGGGGRGVGQPRSHGTNPRSLTSWEVKGSWSAQIAWNESEVTYTLGGRKRGISHRRSHGTNSRPLTSWG